MTEKKVTFGGLETQYNPSMDPQLMRVSPEVEQALDKSTKPSPKFGETAYNGIFKNIKYSVKYGHQFTDGNYGFYVVIDKESAKQNGFCVTTIDDNLGIDKVPSPHGGWTGQEDLVWDYEHESDLVKSDSKLQRLMFSWSLEKVILDVEQTIVQWYIAKAQKDAHHGHNPNL